MGNWYYKFKHSLKSSEIINMTCVVHSRSNFSTAHKSVELMVDSNLYNLNPVSSFIFLYIFTWIIVFSKLLSLTWKPYQQLEWIIIVRWGILLDKSQDGAKLLSNFLWIKKAKKIIKHSISFLVRFAKYLRKQNGCQTFLTDKTTSCS